MRVERDQRELGQVLMRQHGVISRRQALQYLAPGTIERRVTSGRWQAAHRGVYVTHSGPIVRQQRRWVAVLAAGAGRAALLGGLSALETVGFCGFGQDVVHVLIPARSTIRCPPVGVVAHRTSRLSAADVHRLGDPPGTTPARSLIDAAQWASSDDRARAIIAAAFQQRLVRADHVTRVLACMMRARRRALIAEAVADGVLGAHSLPEAEFLRLCRRAALPVPLLQHRRRAERGRCRYLDSYFPEWGVHVEIDGGAAHRPPTMVGRHATAERVVDTRRPGAAVPSWVVRHRPDDVAAQVRAALEAAGWRPRF